MIEQRFIDLAEKHVRDLEKSGHYVETFDGSKGAAPPDVALSCGAARFPGVARTIVDEMAIVRARRRHEVTQYAEVLADQARRRARTVDAERTLEQERKLASKDAYDMSEPEFNEQFRRRFSCVK
jgi:hypothetical protein